MGLPAGSKLGPYEIVSPLGAGGMGEVYRARDTRLDRDVAVKVLPARLASDPIFKQRFEREARTVSSLNHPHICTLYDIGCEGETDFLVMEYLEGETLAERLKRGPLPLTELVKIGMEISDALDKAHRKGVVHRDLKPSNIMLTPPGRGGSKLMDFGLAKPTAVAATSSSAGASAPLLSAAMTADGASPGSPLTTAGTLVGTIQYMSPEQIEGKEADARSDIFALGSTLYEMATGERAFLGKSQISVASAILEKEPEPIIAKQPLVPVTLDRVVGQCLAKDPDERFQNAHDVGLELKWVSDSAVGASQWLAQGEAAPRPYAGWRRALPWALAGLLAVALVSVLYLWKSAAPAQQGSPVFADIPPPAGTSLGFTSNGAAPVAVSPDGKQLAFAATGTKGAARLYLQPLASKQAKVIAGTEDASSPFWSPDGGSLGFFADGKLKTVSLANGNVQVLADATCWGNGGAWSPSGIILFTPSCSTPLFKVPSSGGRPTPATKLQNREVDEGTPVFLPDGRHFLYVPNAYTSPNSIWMGSLDSSKQSLVLKGGSFPQFASGNLFFTLDNRVFARPFDPATGKLSGKAVALAEAQTYSVSEGGVLAYQGGTIQARLEWFDRSGNSLATVGPVGAYQDAKISPDGKHILAGVLDPENHSVNLWSFPSTGGPGTRLTFGNGNHLDSVWSPDGKYIAYSCQSKGRWGICRKPSNGSGAEEQLITFGAEIAYAQAIDWSPDGRYLSFDEVVGKVSQDEVWVLPLFGDRKPFRPAPADADQANGVFSPDGHWMAYGSKETGRYEVYVVSFPALDAKFQISQNGGGAPRWDKKGHLYFRTVGNRLVEANLETSGKSLRVKALQPLFQWSPPSLNIAWDKFYDVNADGSRFLMLQSTDPNASRSIGLLLNWQARLKGNQ